VPRCLTLDKPIRQCAKVSRLDSFSTEKVPVENACRRLFHAQDEEIITAVVDA
jgi:hypothetical protein